jgi:hypothetical protein
MAQDAQLKRTYVYATQIGDACLIAESIEEADRRHDSFLKDVLKALQMICEDHEVLLLPTGSATTHEGEVTH